ncbi:MAG: DUF4180 domain-containing protein [Anaerolineae bacterium]
MYAKVVELNQQTYVECLADLTIAAENDILDLIVFCGENGVQRILFHQENLSPDFFDLKTGLAGLLFQKLANYQLKAAVLVSLEKIQSPRFKELTYECNRGQQIRFYEDKSLAEAWLLGA